MSLSLDQLQEQGNNYIHIFNLIISLFFLSNHYLILLFYSDIRIFLSFILNFIFVLIMIFLESNDIIELKYMIIIAVPLAFISSHNIMMGFGILKAFKPDN